MLRVIYTCARAGYAPVKVYISRSAFLETTVRATILVKSSSKPDPYGVEIAVEESRVSLFCDCPAGVLGKYCKHKEAIALGDKKILFDEAQLQNYELAAQAIASSGIPDLFVELRDAELAAEKAKKHAKFLKAKIARSMTDGIE